MPVSRVFRVVVTQEVIAVVEPGAEVNIPTVGLLTASDGDRKDGADFGAIVRDAIQSEDCGSLMWITAGAASVSDIVELDESRP